MKRKTISFILLGLALACAVVAHIYCNANKCKTVGKFDGAVNLTDANGKAHQYYHFKSNDDEVWWLLSEKELGFVPSKDVEYTLIYNDRGTTKANKPCDCAPEFECECEVYDDVFVGIREISK